MVVRVTMLLQLPLGGKDLVTLTTKELVDVATMDISRVLAREAAIAFPAYVGTFGLVVLGVGGRRIRRAQGQSTCFGRCSSDIIVVFIIVVIIIVLYVVIVRVCGCTRSGTARISIRRGHLGSKMFFSQRV
jgi:hypothetical protein